MYVSKVLALQFNNYFVLFLASLFLFVCLFLWFVVILFCFVLLSKGGCNELCVIMPRWAEPRRHTVVFVCVCVCVCVLVSECVNPRGGCFSYLRNR